jgi:hypothetical protein
MADTAASPRSTKASPKSAAAKASRARGAAGVNGRSRATHRAGTGRGKSSRSTGGARGTASRTAASRTPVEIIGDYAERAVLIPVGAALVAREQVASSLGDVISSYSTPTRAQVQLRRFEHRGSTARSRLEREVRKTRTRVERELRERRRELERRREDFTKSLSAQVEQTQTQIEDALRARLDDGADLANRLQERVSSLV